MEHYTSISKSSDEDNCVSFSCPHCNERFKLEVNEFEEFEGDKLYCPSCGLHSVINEFYSDDMMEAAEVEAINMAKDLINNMFKDLSKKSSKHIRLKNTPLKKETSPTLYEKDDLELFKTGCCHRIIKINPVSYSIKPYCPYCGGIS